MPLLKKPNKGSASMVSGGSNPSLHQALKHLQLSAKSEIQSEKTVGKLLSNWLNPVLQIWLASTVGLWWVYPRKESRELERTDSHRHVIVSRIRNINLLTTYYPVNLMSQKWHGDATRMHQPNKAPPLQGYISVTQGSYG
ncbi:hypothetical protein HanRHA438_Chr12g0537491 [Helianthus annuus]|nr:hypothetical protein HanRHA438_Chr12g0537491 [Helianthus annuus]